MQRRESLYPGDWFRVARNDLTRARILSEANEYEGAAFYIQQAIEKGLKGYLLSKGWQLRRIHDLEALLNDAIAYDLSLEQFRRECQKATEYYLEERYPSIGERTFSAQDIQRSLTVAANWCRS